jgi:hypothetical protein
LIVNVCLASTIRTKPNVKALPVSGRHGIVADNPIVVMVQVNGHANLIRYCCHISLFNAPGIGYTYLFAVHIFFHCKIVGRALDAITSQKLSQVLFVDFGTTAGSAKGKEVLINGRERLGRHTVILFTFKGTPAAVVAYK